MCLCRVLAWHLQTSPQMGFSLEPLSSFSISKGRSQQAQSNMPSESDWIAIQPIRETKKGHISSNHLGCLWKCLNWAHIYKWLWTRARSAGNLSEREDTPEQIRHEVCWVPIVSSFTWCWIMEVIKSYQHCRCTFSVLSSSFLYNPIYGSSTMNWR